MSSSKKKQLRKEQYMTERQAAAAKEAKKLKRYTLTFWVVIALVACIFIGAVISNPLKNVIYKHTDAIQVGDHTLSSVELNYFYVDAINTYVNKYSSVISYILDTSKPLDEQIANSSTGDTWADSFLVSAQATIKSTYALYDEAVRVGHKLSEDEQTSITTTLATTGIYAQLYGYSDLDAYLRAAYGNGADEDSYRNYLEVSALATSYYNAYSDSLEYTADDLLDYQKSISYQYNSYTFASYYLSAVNFREGGTKDDKGNITYSDDEKKAAIEACKAAADKLGAGEYATLDEFDEAIKALDKELKDSETSSAASTKNTDLLYSKIDSLFRDWITGKTLKDGVAEADAKDEDYEYIAHKDGDVTVIEYASGSGDSKTVNGYYVLRFGSVNANDFALKNVRHLLVKFEGGTTSNGTTTYSDAEKAAAKEKAEKLLAQWEAGEKTEASFIELVKANSADNADEGGLYEDIYPGQMITNFNDWCFDDSRQTGDYDIIEGDSGYHIMYFVSNSDITYRDYMITEDIRADDLDEWSTALTEAIKLEVLTDKHVKKDFVIRST